MSRDYESLPVKSLDSVAAKRIIEHMNADHSGALLLYARAFGGIEGLTGARMVSVDLEAMTLAYEHPDGNGTVQIAFEPPLSGPQEARPRLVALVAEARRRLGMATDTHP